MDTMTPPPSSPTPPASPPSAAPAADGQGKKFIVVIEDEEVISGLLVNKLEKAGYEVKSAGDGVVGLALIRERKPDLVLLDMMLPRLNGFGVLEKLVDEKFLPELPVVVISNSGQPVEIDRAIKMGVKDYLIKVNFNPNEVLSKVEQIFAVKDAPSQPVAEAQSAGSQISALIIEDDIFLVELLERKFIQEKFKTFRAMEVEQARQILKTQHIDIILLDIVLPGMDGFVFLAELKSTPGIKDIPVIIISNLGQQEEMQRGLKAGAADYIIKAHATPGEIVQKVLVILKK